MTNNKKITHILTLFAVLLLAFSFTPKVFAQAEAPAVTADTAVDTPDPARLEAAKEKWKNMSDEEKAQYRERGIPLHTQAIEFERKKEKREKNNSGWI
jgi:hypothetical protein